MAPEELELSVTLPVESALNGLPSVRRIRSTTQLGVSQVTIEFDSEMDCWRARQLVSERLAQVLPQLPAGTKAPLVSSLKPGEMHVTDMEGTRHEWATDGGFVSVRKNETLVLVGEAVPTGTIDGARARARLERAQATLERAREGDGDIFRAEREVRFAEVLVHASNG